jgi:hypothetical protein
VIRIEAILPKKKLDPANVQRGLNTWLRDFAFEFQREMQEYPAAKPWKNPPRSGLRKGGRRTGTYGKGWTGAPQFTSDSVTIINRVGYAVYVGGAKRKRPGQTRVMAGRQWKSVSDVGPEVSRRILPRLSKLISP